MSAALKSYVEKYLLNPGASFNLLDEDGNQDAEPEVVGALPEGEGAKGGQVSVSKLRARSAALQMEKDPRYRGKKVSRQDLKKDQDVEFDPELTKYFLIEGEEEDEDGGGSEAVEGSDEDGGGSEAVEGSDEDGGGSEVVEGSDEDGGGSEAVEGSDEDGGGSEAVEGSDEGSRDENDDNENIESDEELSSGDEAEEALGQASVSKPAGVRLNKKMSKKRTYSDAFLRHGFVNLPSGGEDRPQCVVCHKVLTNESLKPSKLSAHLQKCHPNLQNKDQAYFQCRAVALKNIQFGSSGIQAQKLQAAVEASYFVAYKVAEQQKCHTIAENLIMPCAFEMVSKVYGEDQAKKLSVISLSNNTIRRRVDDMASDILSQVTTEIKESSYSKFSLQFDESCDVASCAVLLGFVRYVHQDKIKEEFLLCEDLLTTTKGEDVFNIINSFFTTNGLDWNSVQQVSVDGAPSMMGGHRGLRGLIQAVNPEISVDHCIIHRYSLGSKSLPGNLKLVFEDVLKIVNFIKSRDLNSRIFKELCKEMGEQYQVLLYHTDVRWLSRGKVVRRVIELRKAIQEFLEQKGSPFATKFMDKEWLARLCYLADIFSELNSGNLQLQGRNTTVIDAHQTVTAFLGKLRLWIRRLEKGVIAQFPTLDQFVEENSHDTGSLLQTINKEMSDHLKGLETSMHHYFPESDQETASLQWIISPFSVPDEAIHDDDFPAKEEWITMRANEALKIEFQNQYADSFWISRLADSPTLSKRALKLLVSFSTTYLCEKGFSTVLGMKTKKRTRLNVANDARLALSTTKPRIPQLASSMQLHPSH